MIKIRYCKSCFKDFLPNTYKNVYCANCKGNNYKKKNKEVTKI